MKVFFVFLGTVFLLQSCDTGQLSTDQSLKPFNVERKSSLLSQRLSHSEIILKNSICSAISRSNFRPDLYSRVYNFQQKYQACDAEVKEFDLSLTLQQENGQYFYDTGIVGANEEMYFKSVEQEDSGSLAFYCNSSGGDDLRIHSINSKNLNNLNNQRVEYFEFYHPPQTPPALDSYPCSVAVLNVKDSLCVKITKGKKIPLIDAKGKFIPVSSDRQNFMWMKQKDGSVVKVQFRVNILEVEMMSFIINPSLSLNGLVQYRARFSKKCSDPSKVVQLSATLQLP